jgi:hypothetical protein
MQYAVNVKQPDSNDSTFVINVPGSRVRGVGQTLEEVKGHAEEYLLANAPAGTRIEWTIGDGPCYVIITSPST